MRETGPVSKQLSNDETGDASAQVGAARTQLGILKNIMRLGGMPSAYRTVNMADGTTMYVSSINGRDTVNIQAAPSASNPVPFEQAIQIPNVHVEVPEVIQVPGIKTSYSQVYSSSVLKGAVMDKTGQTVFLAFASPDYAQNFSRYIVEANASQLVRLNATLVEQGRTLIGQPDWSGQLTYDFTSDSFYLNTFLAIDPTFSQNASRALVRIDKSGATTAMGGETLNAASSYPASTWGMTFWQQDGQFPLARDALRNPSNWTFQGVANGPFNSGGQGTGQGARLVPISQPSTSGLIAVLWKGDLSLSGFAGLPSVNPFGYAFLWSTLSQSIVWKGDGEGTYKGNPILDGFGDIVSFGTQNRYDPWATITPNGNAIFSVSGQPFVQRLGGDIAVTAPPAGTTAVAVTKNDRSAFAIVGSSLFQFSAKNGWNLLGLPGIPFAVLHDIVTDAVAVITTDLTITILNGTTPTGDPIAPFSFSIANAPVIEQGYVYPQQFINGSLLISYAFPFTGDSPDGGVEYLASELVDSIPVFPPPAKPFGQASELLIGQTNPAWVMQLNRPGLPDATAAQTLQQCSFTGKTDPVKWIIGRYDVLVLTQPSN